MNVRAFFALFLVLLLFPGMAAPSTAPQRGTADKPSQLRVFDVKEKDGQILSYRYLGASTDVVMRGTDRAPEARIKLKVGSRPGFVEIDINRGQITGLKPASQFGMDFLTYVLWAVSVDGKAANLGEITFVDDKPVSINVTTPYQTFWLMLTAEPNYAVVDPSPVIVLYSANENRAKQPGEKTAQNISGNLVFYTHYGDYDTKPMPADRSPNALLQARKAVELASKSGILGTGTAGLSEAEEARTRDALTQAKDYLALAEKAYKENPNGSDVAQFSRTAAQIAENARALALGAVGGALVRQLEHEVQKLREQLAARAATVTATVTSETTNTLTPPPLPVTLPAVIEDEPKPTTMVASVMTKPLTWFGVVGWVLALLLLFRRRSI